MMLKIKKTEQGFSLLELLLVVAVGAILILAGLAIYRNITQNTAVNEASRLVNVLKQETQRLYQGESVYGGAGTNLDTILTNADVVPARNTTGAGQIVSPFSNSAVNVVAQVGNFDIVMNGVPQDACFKLGLEYTANDPDFQQVDVNGTALAAPTVALVDANCNPGAVNVLTWTFN